MSCNWIKLNELDKADKFLKLALNLNPTCPDLWNNIGLIHYWQDDYIKAYEELETAMCYNDKDGQILFNLGLCAVALRKNSEALEYFEKCSKVNPEFYDAYNNKAIMLEALWRIDECIEWFKKAIQVDDKNHYALYNLGSLLKDLGRNEEAIKYYKKILPISEAIEKVYFNLGCLLARNNDIYESSKYFNKAINYIRELINANEDYKEGVFLDCGYEVCYSILVKYNDNNIKLKEVKAIHQLARFNIEPHLRKWIEYASSNKITTPINDNDIIEKLSIKKGYENKLSTVS